MPNGGITSIAQNHDEREVYSPPGEQAVVRVELPRST
jgi:hypothetical protein